MALQAIGRTVRALRVEHAFGLLGSGNFELAAAMEAAGVRFWGSAHEAGAVGMADGYARVSGRTAVASLSQGPGLTNALTSLTEAVKSRTPMVVFGVDAARRSLHANLDVDQAALARTLGAGVERVRGADTVADDVVRAFRLAEAERRPVLLLVPLDVQREQAAGALNGSLPSTAPPPAPWPGEEQIAEIADLVESARRPVILAGRGAMLADAREELEALAEQIGALLATSAVAKGLFAGNPYALGVSGSFASPVAAELLPEADLVLAFGASLNVWTTFNGTMLAPDAAVVQVDVDAAALGRHRAVTLGVVGDAAATARALSEELRRRGAGGEGFRTAEVARRIEERDPFSEFDDASGDGRLDPRTLSLALDRRLPRNRTLVMDSGHFMGWPTMYVSVPDAAGFVYPEAFQSVGLGIGIGTGAAIARPDRLTVVAIGDGGLRMSLGELETAARHDLPMVFVVYDDAAYGAEVHRFGPMGLPAELAQLPDRDFAVVAEGLGVRGITVRRLDDLARLDSWLAQPRGPVLLDCKIDPAVRGHWVAGNNRAAVH